MDIEKQYRELQKNRKHIKFINVSYEEYISNYINKKKKKLKLAIIVPFREHKGEKIRTHQLRKFIKHMKTFFSNKDISMKIFVINQMSYDKKFNRGLLLNIGFDFAKKYNIIVTHDVDMLPDDYLLNYYLHIPKQPLHIVYPGCSNQLNRFFKLKRIYNYHKYIGGINIYSSALYKKLNGFPNTFWGWGGEDDALYERIANNKMSIIRPNKGKIIELPHKSFHKQIEYTNTKKWENRVNDVKNWKKNGLINLKYKISSIKKTRWYTIINCNI